MSFVQRRKFLWILFLVGLALIGVVANATTLARLRFDDMARLASAVARVRCVNSAAFWKSGEIWTETEFLVEEESKGALPRVIIVQTPGGIVGSLHSRVEEVPVFHAGEEAYVFLWQSPSGDYRLLGWSQGTFRIAREAETGAEYVTQDSAAAPVFDPLTRQFRRGGIRRVPIGAFQLKLRKALQKADR